MSVKPHVTVGEIPDSLWVLASAVKYLMENQPTGGFHILRTICLQLIVGGRAVETTRKLGFKDGLWAEILEGLKKETDLCRYLRLGRRKFMTNRLK